MENKLKKEFKKFGYGYINISKFSDKAREYILDRYNRGIKQLKSRRNLIWLDMESGYSDNGYTALLGVWKYTKSKGIESSINNKIVYMATLLNNKLI